MTRRACVRLVLVALGLLLPRPGWGQVRIGAEVARDRSTYHFDSPSTYDTTVLVPHFFEQHYVLDSVWLTGTVAYRAGIDWRTTAGVTPRRQALATDYDTFFDPGGVTWKSGTTGDALVRSIRLAQETDLGRVGAVRFSGGYRLRVDQADFLEGDRTDTRNDVIVSRWTVTSPEYTSAQNHEAFVRASHVREWSSRWQLRLSGDAAPAAVSRLAVRLPEKYPGQTLVFQTTSLVTSGRLELVRTPTRWPIAMTLQAGRSWNYRTDQRVRHSQLTLGVTAGRAW